MQQLVFEDALQGFESVMAEQPADDHVALHVLERTEQECGGHRDLVLHAVVRPAVEPDLPNLPHGLTGGAGEPA